MPISTSYPKGVPIEDADLFVSSEFCLDNNLDCVIIGEEYKGTKDSYWYWGPIELGIHKYISRFEELSTTDIIKKIISNRFFI